MNGSEFILVAAPTKPGEQFIHLLKHKRLPFVVVTNNKKEQLQLSKLGVDHVIRLDTVDCETWVVPEYPIGKIFLFEDSLTQCCRYLQITRKWTSEPVYVITASENPRLIYKGLGADFVIHSKTGNVSFLVN
jgi:hypothetical protein